MPKTWASRSRSASTLPIARAAATRSLSGGLLVGLSANALNLFDTKPGRALKAFLIAAPGSGFAPVAILLLPYDLRERVMLGDSGSNALGAVVGLKSVGDLDNGVRFFQRYNGNGVDMNRDWPTMGFTFRPYTPWSEPETRSFGNSGGTIGVRSYAGNVLWTNGVGDVPLIRERSTTLLTPLLFPPSVGRDGRTGSAVRFAEQHVRPAIGDDLVDRSRGDAQHRQHAIGVGRHEVMAVEHQEELHRYKGGSLVAVERRGEELGAHVDRELRLYAKIIKSAGIKPE